jgi:hypothetical protein
MTTTFHLGGESSSFVKIEVLGRERPQAADYSDGNWLVSSIEVSAGPWNGRYGANLRADEFASFRQQLQNLYDDRDGPPAVFESMEPWLRFSVARSDKLGHIRVSGEARMEPFSQKHNVLQFVLELDQSYLPSALAGLATVDSEFPVVGSPTDR